MQIYPAIDIKDGKCVRLKQGDFSQETVLSDAPELIAKSFVLSGATYIHVVDLDGARYGSSYSNTIIKRIVDVSGVPIQTGGGIRSMDDIKEKLEMGVSRVILGTSAITDTNFVQEAIDTYGEKIVIGIDASDGIAAISGWEQLSGVTAVDLCKKVAAMGASTVIYTDISKDCMMQGPNIRATRELIEIADINIIASGGVSSLSDLENVKKINADGVIIGMALYRGAINLKEAIEIYQD